MFSALSIRNAVFLAIVTSVIDIAAFVIYANSTNAAWWIPSLIIHSYALGLAVNDARRRERRGFIAFFLVLVVPLLVSLIGLAIFTRRQERQQEHARIAPWVATIISLLPGILVLTYILIETGSLTGKPYKIPSAGMSPTIQIGDRIYAAKARNLKRNDIVVYNGPADIDSGSNCSVAQPAQSVCPTPATVRLSSYKLVSRIVGLPGEQLAVKHGEVIINGKPLHSPSASSCTVAEQCDFPKPITIPNGHYFLMSDNRENAVDSRSFGAIPSKWILNQASLVYWPYSHIKKLQ